SWLPPDHGPIVSPQPSPDTPRHTPAVGAEEMPRLLAAPIRLRSHGLAPPTLPRLHPPGGDDRSPARETGTQTGRQAMPPRRARQLNALLGVFIGFNVAS